MKRYFPISVLASCLLIVSCVGEYGGRNSEYAKLTLNSVAACARSKAVIQTDTLGSADAAAGIGICLLSESGSAYNGNASYGNVRVYRNSGKWNFATSVYLTETCGTLYACFPYDPELKDFSFIPVAASLGGTDYLYGEPVEKLNNRSSSADISMRHALSRIAVRFVKDDSYKGPAILSGITLKSDGLSSSGVLNAKNGKIAAEKSVVSLQGGGKIIPEGFVADCLVVPVSGKEEESLPLGIECVIDGTQFKLPLQSAVRISGGLQTTITVNVRPEGLSVVDLWTEPWVAGHSVSGTVDGMHKVNICLESEELAKDVLFQGYSQGTDFVIEAYSRSGKTLECSVPEDCVCMPSQNWDTGIYKFTISGFKKDITALISYPNDEEVLKQIRNVRVRNTAFYKTAFVDAGYMFDQGVADGVTKNPPVALKELLLSTYGGDNKWDYMEMILLDHKYIEDTSFIKKFFDGYSSKTGKVDLNGPLLYPDGDPRYSVYFCFGGNASTAHLHKACIGDENMGQLRTFFENGGSFVASGGAGTVFLGSRYEGEPNGGYLSLYDANTCWTHTSSNEYKQILMAENSPLLEFGASEKVNNVINNYGVFLDENSVAEGTEILARYGSFSGTGYDNTGKAAVWAYKKSENSGRLVLCGSKAELNPTTAVKDFFKSEISYAIEGNGLAKVKGVLHNGETRKMDLKQGDPAFCAIGDRQCHHFVFNLKQDAPKLFIKLDWETDARLDIYLKRGTFAFPEAEPEYSLLSSASEDPQPSSVLELENVPAGLWFLTVRCDTAPVSSRSSSRGGYDWSYYYSYSGTAGQTATLGGIPYSVSAMWTY